MISITNTKRGYLLIQTLIFGAIAIVIIGGLIAYASANILLGRRVVLSEQAFQIAEAGLEYYRWHLAHAPGDFTNGTGQPGPYVKDFYDQSGTLLGNFSLSIIPPELGSTLVTVSSVGTVVNNPNITRTIVTKLSIPSFANFAAVTNSAMRFGEGTEVFGPVHSNNGLHFDGLAYNIVTSAVASYNDPDHNGNNEFGVHTHVNPPPSSGINSSFRSLEAPPNVVPARPDVFSVGRSFPAPVVDFSNITDDLANMKTQAENEGFYLGGSGVLGYRVVLKVNNTFDLYSVNTLTNPPAQCTNVAGQSGWSSWSVNSTTLLGNYALPANGLMFFDDNLWVEGVVDGGRVTIVAAHLPEDVNQRRTITINNNLTYTNYDGADSIALIAQDDINAGMVSANDLRIDAALVAQYGRVGRYYYEDDCNPYNDRDSLTLYGTIVTAERYGFAYTDGSGYNTRTIIYDAYLLYSPPPFFPQTTPFYDVIYWQDAS